ncbi:hypothetical protein TNCV_24831 [Trichonephila clavipes]|uniref:Uncharacterized protein n=1 Tax=Trichonephila clavipes TaxID=2585209 RepID=A0A8X6W125_TRICX|nr:hypothetical protein TNCV_24831 [Trichonephila clavipes]
MVLKATANDRRHLTLCHDEFRGPRSGLYRSGGIINNNILILKHRQVTRTTPELPPLTPNFHTKPTGEHLSVDILNTHWLALHGGSSAVLTRIHDMHAMNPLP